jgi:transcriptional regulator with GAF, ATPase, and Fis domain
VSALAKLDMISDDDVVACDPTMLRLLDTARAVARHKTAVLITGETGSGKEVVARLIHRWSDRSSRPWIDVNCATLPEHLVESELFGYEKGAFSGAETAKPGLFELANGGTLFLDEIGEIDPRVQVKLLRVLDSIPYFRLGGRTKVSVDVRLIAATNRNLEAAVESGTFRRDLYHRITEFHLALPPLRERPHDISALAGYFLKQRRPDMTFTAEALAALASVDWPGNVRELRSFVNAMSMLLPHANISADDVYCQLDRSSSTWRRHGSTTDQPATVADMERQLIMRTLESAGGNQTLAAQQLGMPRRTLCRRLNTYNITLGRRNNTPSRVLSNCRAELHVPVVLTTGHGRRDGAQACDLSIGGIGLYGVDPPVTIGEPVSLTFHLPNHPLQIDAHAEVAWFRGDGSTGLKFTHLSSSARELIRHWISGGAQPADSALERTTPPDASREQLLCL